MAERSNPHTPGSLTFEHGRVPDGQPGPHGVPQPATTSPPGDHTRATVLACLLVAALAVALAAVLR